MVARTMRHEVIANTLLVVDRPGSVDAAVKHAPAPNVAVVTASAAHRGIATALAPTIEEPA